MRKWILAVFAVGSLALAACTTTIEGEARRSEGDSRSDQTISSTGLSITEMCESLLVLVDASTQLDPDADRSETLQSVFDESRSSSEWKTTPLDERHRIEEAFGRAESGRC
ncbi:hypothetical protein RCF19_03805 [Rhodococcus qingshengii]